MVGKKIRAKGRGKGREQGRVRIEGASVSASAAFNYLLPTSVAGCRRKAGVSADEERAEKGARQFFSSFPGSHFWEVATVCAACRAFSLFWRAGVVVPQWCPKRVYVRSKSWHTASSIAVDLPPPTLISISIRLTNFPPRPSPLFLLGNLPYIPPRQ